MVKKIIFDDFKEVLSNSDDNDESSIEIPKVKEVKERKKGNYVLTEARKAQFEKAREIKKLNFENRKKIKEQEEELKKQELEKKIVQKAEIIKKKQIKKEKILDNIVEPIDETPIEIVKIKKPKKKIVIVEDSSSEEEVIYKKKNKSKEPKQHYPTPSKQKINFPNYV